MITTTDSLNKAIDLRMLVVSGEFVELTKSDSIQFVSSFYKKISAHCKIKLNIFE